MKSSLRAALVRSLAALGAAAATLELMPRLPWVHLPNDLGNALFQCYEPEYPEESIFALSPKFGLRLQKPTFRASCYLNGKRWQHQTDAYGQRNPQTWETVDAAVVGDASVYGEGIEEDETAVHALRDLLGWRVANLGLPEATAADYLPILQNFALPLHPRVAVVILSGGDLGKLARFDEGRLEPFVLTEQGPETNVFPREQWLATEQAPGHRSLGDWLFAHCLTCRTFRYYAAHRRASQRITAWLAGTADLLERSALGAVPLPHSGDADRAGSREGVAGRESMALAYLDASLRAMVRSTKAEGVRLVVAYVPGQPDSTRRTEEPLPPHLARVSAELGFEFLDVSRDLLATDRYGHLELDRYGEGLFAKSGQRKLAELLALFLKNPGAFVRSR
jgi:hypothetical protein